MNVRSLKSVLNLRLCTRETSTSTTAISRRLPEACKTPITRRTSQTLGPRIRKAVQSCSSDDNIRGSSKQYGRLPKEKHLIRTRLYWRQRWEQELDSHELSPRRMEPRGRNVLLLSQLD